MKTILTLAAALLFTQAPAQASDMDDFFRQRANCAFGESSGDLDDHLDLPTGAPGKIWYKGEHLSLHKVERLGGLSRAEREMILAAENGDARQEKEVLRNFSAAEGYITYFSHNSLDREFAIVASFPGDNEHGAVLEIKREGRSGAFRIVGVAAVIADGDFEDCKVTKAEVQK